MKYIQLKTNNQLETIDEFKTLREAADMLTEYRISDPYGYYYISSRPCDDWRKKDENKI